MITSTNCTKYLGVYLYTNINFSYVSLWKMEIEPLFTSIFKKGNRSTPANYRPISLTSVLCKVMEHIIFHVCFSWNSFCLQGEYACVSMCLCSWGHSCEWTLFLCMHVCIANHFINSLLFFVYAYVYVVDQLNYIAHYYLCICDFKMTGIGGLGIKGLKFS